MFFGAVCKVIYTFYKIKIRETIFNCFFIFIFTYLDYRFDRYAQMFYVYNLKYILHFNFLMDQSSYISFGNIANPLHHIFRTRTSRRKFQWSLLQSRMFHIQNHVRSILYIDPMLWITWSLKLHSEEKTLLSNWKALVKKAGQQRYVDKMLLTVDAPIRKFITTICNWMASNGEAPPIIIPVMAPGSDIRPTVFALSSTGERASTNALFTCWAVACLGVAPKASAVSTWKNHTKMDQSRL